MVGFSLGEITGHVVDTAQERVDRLQASFDAAIAAYLDLRFDDARHFIDDMKGEVDDTELFIEIYDPSALRKAENPSSGSR